MTARVPWFEEAACAGMAPLFDATVGERPAGRSGVDADRLRHDAAAAVCARCPVTVECLADARPGRDEGVRAGVVLPSITGSRPARGGPRTAPDHGTEAGYMRHRRAGEPPCRACREGTAAVWRERAAARRARAAS